MRIIALMLFVTALSVSCSQKETPIESNPAIESIEQEVESIEIQTKKVEAAEADLDDALNELDF